SLAFNNLTGEFPSWLGLSFLNLVELHLNDNHLEKPLPESIGGFQALRTMSLAFNSLTGIIPASIGSMKSLQALTLSNNRLDGPIPESLQYLPLLAHLRLKTHNLSLPLFEHCPSLLHDEHCPSLPLSRLVPPIRSLHYCSLSGSLPPSLTLLPLLSSLHLSHNLLSGPLPPLLSSLSALTTLHLSHNLFLGVIPDPICDMHMVADLDLSANQLQGTIPPCLVEMPTLRILSVAFNNLSGPVPELPAGSELQFMYTPGLEFMQTRFCVGYVVEARMSQWVPLSPTCRYCKKTGHTIDECFKLKKKKELEESSKREKSVFQPSVHVSTSSSAEATPTPTPPPAPSTPQSVPDSRYVDIAVSTSHHPIFSTWTPLVAAVFILTILLLLLLFPYGAPYASAFTASSFNMERTSSWLVDSGASSHICSDRSLFSSLKKPNEEILVRFGGGETYKVLGVGTVVATLRSPTSKTTIQLDNVLFLPSSVHNLLSVRALGAAGVAVSFPAAGRVVLTSDDVPIGEGYTRNNLFYLQLHHGSSAAPSIKPTACPASTTTSSYLWHRRFGHLNMQALSTLHRQQLVTGLHLSSTSIPPCISCYRGKQTRQPFGVSHSRTTAPLQLIHSDIAGPLSYGTTIGGARYLLTFIDDYSRHITVYLLRHRSEALSCFKAYVTRHGVILSRDVIFMEPSAPPSDDSRDPPSSSPPTSSSLPPPTHPSSLDPISPPSPSPTIPSSTNPHPQSPNLPAPATSSPPPLFSNLPLPSTPQDFHLPSFSPPSSPPPPHCTTRSSPPSPSALPDPSLFSFLKVLPSPSEPIDFTLPPLSNTSANAALHHHYEPQTIHEARTGPDAAEWIKAADAELAALHANDTYSIQECPSGYLCAPEQAWHALQAFMLPPSHYKQPSPPPSHPPATTTNVWTARLSRHALQASMPPSYKGKYSPPSLSLSPSPLPPPATTTIVSTKHLSRHALQACMPPLQQQLITTPAKQPSPLSLFPPSSYDHNFSCVPLFYISLILHSSSLPSTISVHTTTSVRAPSAAHHHSGLCCPLFPLKFVSFSFFHPPPTSVHTTSGIHPAGTANHHSPSIPPLAYVLLALLIITVVCVVLFGLFGTVHHIKVKASKKKQMTHLPEFSVSRLRAATRGFSTEHGRGSFGTAYIAYDLFPEASAGAEGRRGHGGAAHGHGYMQANSHTMPPAIPNPERHGLLKRARDPDSFSESAFCQKVALLAAASNSHPCMVHVRGFCANGGERMVVLELVTGGTLRQRMIRGDLDALTWQERVQVAVDVAAALYHLHYNHTPPFVHRAVTSSNVLLTEDMTAKLSDLGSARGSSDASGFRPLQSSLGVATTADVLAYGVLLLELITGQTADGTTQIVATSAPFLDDPQMMPLMADAQLGGHFDRPQLEVLASLARACVLDDAAARPTMHEIRQAYEQHLQVDPQVFEPLDVDPQVLEPLDPNLGDVPLGQVGTMEGPRESKDKGQEGKEVGEEWAERQEGV
ncbi:unnamed protein product, partial [Closterium sp. NIES-65]